MIIYEYSQGYKISTINYNVEVTSTSPAKATVARAGSRTVCAHLPPVTSLVQEQVQAHASFLLVLYRTRGSTLVLRYTRRAGSTYEYNPPEGLRQE